MRLVQQQQQQHRDSQLKTHKNQADEAPPRVPERRSSVKHRMHVPGPSAPPPPPPPPLHSAGCFDHVDLAESRLSRRELGRSARSTMRLPQRPPPVPPPPPPSGRVRRPAPKNIWSPSSSSLTSSEFADSLSPTAPSGEQVVAPASSTSPPSSTVDSTVIEQPQRPLARSRPDIVELGEAGEIPSSSSPAGLANLAGGNQAPPGDELGARTRSASLHQRRELKQHQQRVARLQSRSYSIAAPNERSKLQSTQQQIADVTSLGAPASNSLGRGVESRKAAEHKYWTLPAGLSGSAEHKGVAETSAAAYGPAERGKPDLASQHDESSDGETASVQGARFTQQTADLETRIALSQLAEPADSAQRASLGSAESKQLARDSQNNMSPERDTMDLSSLQNDGERPAGSIKDDWLRRVYHQMHKSTPDRSLLEAANSQPDTGQITVKLKSPKTGE